MDINNLTSELKYVNRIGKTLSTDQIISLQTNVLKLSHQYHFQNYRFWGRIQGNLRNYYIIEGVNYKGSKNFPQKKYFWSSQDFLFAQLPAPRQQYEKNVKNMTQFFTGQHQKILIKSSQQAKSINLDGQQFSVKIKNFTQLDRLSIVVNLVANDCEVVPIGAFLMAPTHQLIKNPAFSGLCLQGIKKAQNYVHLKPPQNQQKKLIIECDKALIRADFLDSIKQDKTKDSWSIQVSEGGNEVNVRSLLWPGYLAYHKAGSKIYGGAYMGYGVRCTDLPFLI